MDLITYLARFWGILLTVICLAFFLNKNLLRYILDSQERKTFIFISGFLALIIGTLQVSIYNYWEASTRGLITLFGYMILLKGIIRLIFPDFVQRNARFVNKNTPLVYLFLSMIFIAGVYLLYVGFY